MPYAVREHPGFSWSHSRGKMFRACQQRYYWHYYRSHRGWERSASEEARLTYQLKQLTTLPLALGSEIHQRASEIALAIREGTPPCGCRGHHLFQADDQTVPRRRTAARLGPEMYSQAASATALGCSSRVSIGRRPRLPSGPRRSGKSPRVSRSNPPPVLTPPGFADHRLPHLRRAGRGPLLYSRDRGAAPVPRRAGPRIRHRVSERLPPRPDPCAPLLRLVRRTPSPGRRPHCTRGPYRRDMPPPGTSSGPAGWSAATGPHRPR